MYSISYDPVSVLRTFSAANDIGFPLISDERSELIERLGIRNRRIRPQAEQYGVAYRDRYEGVCHPGIYVLDADGRVEERRFEESYRVRQTGAVLVEELVGRGGIAGAPVRTGASAPGLTITVACTDTTYRPWMQSKIHVVIGIDDGLHAYARPTPHGYTPLSLRVEAPAPVRLGTVDYPEGKPFRVEGLDDEFFVYDDVVHLSVPFAFLQNHGALEVVVRVRYQVCSSTDCFIPGESVLRLPLKGADHDLPVPPVPGEE